MDSLPDAIGIRILTGEQREIILKARYAQRPRPDGALVIQARQRFPSKSRVTLLWGKGVASLSGVETDQDQALAFEVRGPFTLGFECLRENPRAQCVPFESRDVMSGQRWLLDGAVLGEAATSSSGSLSRVATALAWWHATAASSTP